MAAPPSDYLDMASFNLSDFVTSSSGQPQALNRFPASNASESVLGYSGSNLQDDGNTRNPRTNLMDSGGRITLARDMGDHTLIGNAGPSSSAAQNYASFVGLPMGTNRMEHESFGVDPFQHHQRQHEQSQNHQSAQLQQHVGSGHSQHNPNSMMAAAASPQFMPNLITAESLKQQLAQQVKLQQLQQLQNQILQQQIELISSQSNTQREMLLHGLLTPTSSSELRPTITHNYLSPMTLQAHSTTSSAAEPGSMLPNSTFVSPALTPSSTHAFSMTTPTSLQQATPHLGSSDMFSPLTSPALGPSGTIGNASYHQYDYAYSLSSSSTSPANHDTALPSDFKSTSRLQSQQFGNSETVRRASNKRSMIDESGSRKRQSPMVSASSPGSMNNNAPTSTSQKRMRNTRSRPSSLSAAGGVGEPGAFSTPSPIDIDISMPPPAPPAPPLPPVGLTPASLVAAVSASRQAISVAGSSSSSTSSTSTSPNIVPVTPASIMNLGHLARLPNGLRPTTGPENDASQAIPGDTSIVQLASTSKQQKELQKAPAKPKQTSSAKASPAIQPKGGSTSASALVNKGRTSLPSTPSLLPQPGGSSRPTKPSPVIRPTGHKHILPGGLSTDATSELTRSLTSPHLSGTNRTMLNIDTRSTKTSHKAAEQKRRDSLKAGFDELRLLLPPITIDPDSDEPLLPGSAPPRGPQRNMAPGTEDHPNRTVSKLALLKCSNDFLVKLQKRIERRDDEIDHLRDEVKFLRSKLGIDCSLRGVNEKAGTTAVIDGALDIPMAVLEQILETERDWVDLDKDLDELERVETELKASGRILMGVDEPNVSVTPTGSATPLFTVDKRKPRDGDADGNDE